MTPFKHGIMRLRQEYHFEPRSLRPVLAIQEEAVFKIKGWGGDHKDLAMRPRSMVCGDRKSEHLGPIPGSREVRQRPRLEGKVMVQQKPEVRPGPRTRNNLPKTGMEPSRKSLSNGRKSRRWKACRPRCPCQPPRSCSLPGWDAAEHGGHRGEVEVADLPVPRLPEARWSPHPEPCSMDQASLLFFGVQGLNLLSCNLTKSLNFIFYFETESH